MLGCWECCFFRKSFEGFREVETAKVLDLFFRELKTHPAFIELQIRILEIIASFNNDCWATTTLATGFAVVFDLVVSFKEFVKRSNELLNHLVEKVWPSLALDFEIHYIRIEDFFVENVCKVAIKVDEHFVAKS